MIGTAKRWAALGVARVALRVIDAMTARPEVMVVLLPSEEMVELLLLREDLRLFLARGGR
jgi:hypothetical protein